MMAIPKHLQLPFEDIQTINYSYNFNLDSPIMASTCYTCFDGDNDINYYRLMQAWHANERFGFTFVNAHDITQSRDGSTAETIKRSLRMRLNSSDILLVLIGQNTKNLFKFVRWEMEVALDKGMPIIVINLDHKRGINRELCPPIIRDELAIHVPFGPKIVDYAIRNWPTSHRNYLNSANTGPHFYNDNVYVQLGL